jgi:citrate synthase
MTPPSRIATEIASSDLHHIWVRGLDLTEDLMDRLTFGEMVFLLVGGRLPDPGERRLVDAMLVALVEHGLTPSAVVARMTYSVAPEAFQGAVAAGLLGAGSVVLGSMEECGRLLTRIDDEVSAGADRGSAIAALVDEYRALGRHLPGMGHAIHTEGDPRAPRLYAIAEACGRRGRFLDTMTELSRVAGERAGRRLPINVTGAVAGILLELGVPWQLHKGFALISRSAGLVAHLGEELEAPITPAIRTMIRDAAAAGTASPAQKDEG